MGMGCLYWVAFCYTVKARATEWSHPRARDAEQSSRIGGDIERWSLPKTGSTGSFNAAQRVQRCVDECCATQ